MRISGAAGFLARILAAAVALTPLLALAPSVAPSAAHAQNADVEFGNLGLLSLVKDDLSGAAWLRANGLDPRASARPNRSQRRQMLDAPDFFTRGLAAPQAQGGGVLVPFRDPAPAFSRSVLLTRDVSRTPVQTEPSIAIHPNDPNHVVVADIDFNFPGVSVYTSFNGGETWEGPRATSYLRDDETSGGDPVLAFDRAGNVHLLTISIGEEEFTVGNFLLSQEVSSIVTHKSADGGLTWSEPISSARSGIRSELTVERRPGQPVGADARVRGNIYLSFLDKPWLAIGQNPADPQKDTLYVTYVEFTVVGRVVYFDELPAIAVQEVQSTIRMVRSEDGGQTWAAPIDVSPTVRRASGDTPQPGVGDGRIVGLKRVVQGASPTTAPDGTLYVTWLDSTDDKSQKGLAELYIARSEDGGKTFTKPKVMQVVGELSFRPRNTFFRYWGGAFPKVATGPGGELYTIYAALNPSKPVDDGDIYFTRSLDRGETWSKPIVLGGDRTPSLQFFPAVATDPKGRVHVMWGDMRDDPTQTHYHIYYTTSENRGDSWGFESKELNIRSEDARVTDSSSNPNRGFPQGQFLGDYFGIAATERDVYLVWADTRLGEFGGINQKIGFSRRKAIAAPQVFIQPPAGPGGQEITLQGFNLQPEMNVFVQVGDVTIATERTNADGRFTARLFMPVSGQGAQPIRVLDESGNVATTSFFTEFGFGDVRTTQRAITERLDTITSGTLIGAANGSAVAAGGDETEWWVIVVSTVGSALLAGALASVITVSLMRRRAGPGPRPVGGGP